MNEVHSSPGFSVYVMTLLASLNVVCLLTLSHSHDNSNIKQADEHSTLASTLSRGRAVQTVATLERRLSVPEYM